MSKKISPKRYIYENGVLILKYNHDSTQTNINDEYSSRNINQNLNIEFPILNQKTNNNYKIFSTQINEDILNENKKEESNKNLSFIDDEDNTNKEDKDYNNLKSIEVNQNHIRKKNPIYIRKLNRLKLSSDIKKICKYLYTSPRKNHQDNIKFKLFEKENEYISHLKNKNYLFDEDLINKQAYRNRIKKKNFSSNQNIFDNNIKKNILTENEIIKKYYKEENSNTIDINKLTSYKFEHFKRNIPRYKHPRLYRLKNINKDEDKNTDVKLPPIKIGNQTPIELTEFIPVKKGIRKEEQRNEYIHYKIMRTNRLEGFHI